MPATFFSTSFDWITIFYHIDGWVVCRIHCLYFCINSSTIQHDSVFSCFDFHIYYHISMITRSIVCYTFSLQNQHFIFFVVVFMFLFVSPFQIGYQIGWMPILLAKCSFLFCISLTSFKLNFHFDDWNKEKKTGMVFVISCCDLCSTWRNGDLNTQIQFSRGIIDGYMTKSSIK